METLIVIIFLLCLIVFIEIKNYILTKDLINRLMSRNYQEYALAELENKSLKSKLPSIKEEFPL